MPGLSTKAAVPDPVEHDVDMEEVLPDQPDPAQDIDPEKLEEVLELMQSNRGEPYVTDDLEDFMLDEEGCYDLPPMPTGIVKDGRPVYVKVRVRDPHDPAVIASYVDNETKAGDKAVKDLWDAVVVAPTNLTGDKVFPRLTQTFRDALTVNCLSIAGWDGFFERFKFLAKPGLVQAAITSSTPSRSTTASHQQK